MKKDNFVKIAEAPKPAVYMHTLTIREAEGDGYRSEGAVFIVLSHDSSTHNAVFAITSPQGVDEVVGALLQARAKIWGER